jgi:mono/diheme cytochrome c family protein
MRRRAGGVLRRVGVLSFAAAVAAAGAGFPGGVACARAAPGGSAPAAEGSSLARSAGSAEGDSRSPADPVLADLGAAVFLRRCAVCHGEDGRGNGPAAGALRTPPADLTRIAARRGGAFPEGEIARYIDGRFAVQAHGTREMPIWGERLGERIPEAGVSEEVVRGQLTVLVEYLESIQRKE